MTLFGTSGIRRVFDQDLLQLALKTGLAVGKVYKNVVVGGDTRTSTCAMKNAVIAGLLGAGASCQDAGVVPTPTLACAARTFDAGVMITASHNPPEYNGIKLLNPDGSAFNSAQQKEIENLVLDGMLATSPWVETKDVAPYPEAVEEHIQRILRDFPNKLKTKVVLDCGGGAASAITPQLLKRLGCEVIKLNCQPTGFFPRPSEPVEANLDDLMKAVKETGADVGIAHDGDADRMMAVDERGSFISGDKLLIILARALDAKEIVTTVDASMVIEETGFRVRRTKVGDNYVSEELKRGGDFGGEPSGAWIFPRVSLCPDGILAAKQIALIADQRRLSKLSGEIQAYPIVRGSIESNGMVISYLASDLLSLKPIEVEKSDGFKLKFSDGWLLVRPSGTEPKIRLTAEAKSESRVRELYDSAVCIIKSGVTKETF
jgi:phosphoglucosamine mutase